jgi:hypothetical protein
MHRIFSYVLCFLALVSLSVSEEQIKWTPNESEEASTSLPMSMKQRLQLKELEAAIQSSPDPEGTLTKVAEANNLSPQDLVNMINKNSRDLDENPSLAQPTTIPRAAMKVFASISVIISQSARRRPRSFALLTISLLFLLYASVVIPRTGLQLSKGRSLLSRGPTCLFDPPQSYLQRLADTPGFESSVSIQTKKIKWDDLALKKDGVEAHSLPKKSTLRQAVSAQQSMSPDSLVDALYTEDDDEGDTDIQQKDLLNLLFESTAKLLSNREFAEFPTEARKLRVASSSDSQKHGILVVPGLGTFGRFGLVHWQATDQMESDNQSSLTLTTVKGKGFFDGQLHIQIERLGSKVRVTTHLGVPKNGRKISKRIAMEIVEGMTESIVSSATQRSKQTLARTSQGKRFKSASHRRAGERRGQRHKREKLIEEMAEDRRRKWQRKNPNGGRWTPSGHRMKSPNNR